MSAMSSAVASGTGEYAPLGSVMSMTLDLRGRGEGSTGEYAPVGSVISMTLGLLGHGWDCPREDGVAAVEAEAEVSG